MALSLSLVLALGCSSGGGGTSSSTKNQVSKLGAQCTTSVDCGPSEFCTDLGTRWVPYLVCSKSCSANDECYSSVSSAEWVCGILEDGSRGCVFDNCGGNYYGVACLNGVDTACKAVDDTHCDQCSCPDTQYCGAGGKCIAKVGLGEPCTNDGECLSVNCGAAGHCRVAIGSPCTTDNCDFCSTNSTTGWSACTRACDADPWCTEGSCYARFTTQTPYCYMYCVSGCVCFTTPDGTSFCEL